MNPVDIRLYALVDPELSGGHDLGALAAALAAGGATLVQLRDKHGSTRQMVTRARAIKAALHASGVPFLVNDRVDVALAAEADGVHLGWDDMEVPVARRLLGPAAIIGLSIKNLTHVEAAPFGALDYVCIGGVFATTSKDNPDAPIGLAGLKELLRAVRGRARVPAGAIAGINAGNAAGVIAAGADGVAVISALSQARNPQSAAQELRGLVDGVLSRRAPP